MVKKTTVEQFDTLDFLDVKKDEATVSEQALWENFSADIDRAETVVSGAAQRLVNQFRALKSFRPSFIVEYNEELLNAPNDVISFLPNITAGSFVRAYREYLIEQKGIQQALQQGGDASRRQGYLPSPDTEGELPKASVAPQASAGSSQAVSEALKIVNENTKRQEEVFARILADLKEVMKSSPQPTGVVSADGGVPEQLAEFTQTQSEVLKQTVQEMSEAMQNVSMAMQQVASSPALQGPTITASALRLKKSNEEARKLEEQKLKAREARPVPLLDALDEKTEAEPQKKSAKKSKKAEKAKQEVEAVVPLVSDENVVDVLDSVDEVVQQADDVLPQNSDAEEAQPKKYIFDDDSADFDDLDVEDDEPVLHAYDDMEDLDQEFRELNETVDLDEFEMLSEIDLPEEK